jgi:hypothetical protein
MNRLRKMKMKIYWMGLLFLIALLNVQEVRAEVYSVQTGIFEKLKNARWQFGFIQKSLNSNLLDHLRIEKSGKLYAVRIGKLENQEQALDLLSTLIPIFSDAFIWKGDFIPENVLELKKGTEILLNQQTTEKLPSPPTQQKVPVKPSKAPLSEYTPQADQALIIGTISEVSPFAPEALGLPPGKKTYKLIVRLEETKEIKGYPNILKGREGDSITVFSKTGPPFYKSGMKITAVAEYRGNRLNRLFWIKNPPKH